MARFSLNIYGENDEITKMFQTEHVRWGLLLTALELQEKVENETPEEQIKAINKFVLELFPGITEEDLRNADGRDVINGFAQVGKMANQLNGKNG